MILVPAGVTGQVPRGGKITGMATSVRTVAGLDLVGGARALDFANTINSRLVPVHDYLETYGDLIAWAEHAGILGTDGWARLAELAAGDPAGATRVLGRARAFRERIYEAFSRLAAGKALDESQGRALLGPYGEAVGRGTLQRTAGQAAAAAISWPLDATLGGVLDPIAYSAGELLLDASGPPVKECPGCGWLFIDGSRNGSRRWCDMQTCGSRDKMRRYYRSRRATRARSSRRSKAGS